MVFPTNKQTTYGYDDMVSLEYLNEPELLHNIEKRFGLNLIFTYVGPTLLIVNPYMMITSLFNDDIFKLYQEKLSDPYFNMKDYPPHVYAISVQAMKELNETGKNQAIVISGESGAGKTENTKFAMRLLTTPDDDLEKLVPSCPTVRKNSSCSKEKILNLIDPVESVTQSPNRLQRKVTFIIEGIDQKILGCNPILEAFGNAKTVRNDNSSRFGKLVLLLVDPLISQVKGAFITNFLLEKSRVITQSKGERNYHIFYQLLAGASQKLKEELKLQPLQFYEYLNKSGCFSINNVDDAKEFKDVEKAFCVMKISQNEVDVIFKMVASILGLGNLQFEEKDPDPNKPCTVLNPEITQDFAAFLNLQIDDLKQALLFRTRKIGTQVINSKMTKNECLVIKDSFAKCLFDRLFNWLVKRLNYAIASPECRNMQPKDVFQAADRLSIGLLDIFGFEVFKINSFEQLCINYANERLAQLYIKYIFKGEEEEFRKEGLDEFICELNFKDNKPIIELLEKYPLGIFNLLDESSAINSTDENFLLSITKNHSKNPYFKTQKISKDSFIVCHSAKDVEYSVTGFRIKNKDEVPDTISELMYNTSNVIIRKVFFGQLFEDDEIEEENAPPSISPPNKKKGSKFLSSNFRKQMNDLMLELESCNVNFIRCLKPNELKKKHYFDSNLVLNQIRYLGVLESIKVRKESFPIRRTYATFLEKYFEFHPLSMKNAYEDLIKTLSESDIKKMVHEMVEKEFKDLGHSLILYGNTKVFMRIEASNEIENRLQEKLKFKHKMARKIQLRYVAYKYRKQYLMVLRGLKRIQRIYKVRVEYRRFRFTLKMVRRLQRHFKKKAFRAKVFSFLSKVSQMKTASIKLQTFFRMRNAAKKYRKVLMGVAMFRRQIRKFHFEFQKKRTLFFAQLTNRIVDNAWRCYRRKFEEASAKEIQSLARGFITRKRHAKEVQIIKRAVQSLHEKKAANFIQRVFRGFVKRKEFQKKKFLALKLQGFKKMRVLRKEFLEIKRATYLIQAIVKRFIFGKKILSEAWEAFYEETGNNFDELREAETNCLFGDKEPSIFTSTFESPEEKIKSAEGWQDLLVSDYDPKKQQSVKSKPGIIDTDTSRKIKTDTNDIYKNTWTKSYHSAKSISIKNNNSHLVSFAVGETFSLAVNDEGKVFAWGSNGFGELGSQRVDVEPNIIEFPDSIDKIEAGKTGGMAISTKGDLYCWGDNFKGQLGQGHQKTIFGISKVKVKSPKSFASSGDTNFCSTKEGKLFAWPFQGKSVGKIYKPVEIPIRGKVETLCCGSNFVMFTSLIQCS